MKCSRKRTLVFFVLSNCSLRFSGFVPFVLYRFDTSNASNVALTLIQGFSEKEKKTAGRIKPELVTCLASALPLHHRADCQTVKVLYLSRDTEQNAIDCNYEGTLRQNAARRAVWSSTTDRQLALMLAVSCLVHA